MHLQQILSMLDLQVLPIEGGYYRVTYTAAETIPQAALPPRYQSDRPCAGAIYFLATAEQFSALHRLPTDEIYYFHYGDPLQLLLLRPNGGGEVHVLGANLLHGHRPQLVAPRDCWQGSRPLPGGKFGYSLLSTSMAPAYADADVEFPSLEELQNRFAPFAKLIRELAR